MSTPVYNPGQPFIESIPGGFSAGKIAHVSGSFTPNASSIILKLQTGPHGDPADDIGLCLYGRHRESLLGCNTFTRNSGWGVEDAKPTGFLVGGSQFDITILCDPIQFKIAVNRQHFSEYNHRLDPGLLTHLSIVSGPNDVILSCVWVEGQPGGNVPNSAGFAPSQSHHPAPCPPSNPQYGASSVPPQYANSSHQGHKDKGLLGMVTGAGTAVAGALGVSHLLGSKGKTHGYGGHPSNSNHGYGGYPSSSHHGYGHSNMMGGNLAQKAMALGGGVMAAKAAKKGLGGGGKMLKYGLPLAGVGLGGYALSKGLSNSFDCDFSDSDGCCDSDSD